MGVYFISFVIFRRNELATGHVKKRAVDVTLKMVIAITQRLKRILLVGWHV
jgi:hypothetical protein